MITGEYWHIDLTVENLRNEREIMNLTLFDAFVNRNCLIYL